MILYQNKSNYLDNRHDVHLTMQLFWEIYANQILDQTIYRNMVDIRLL